MSKVKLYIAASIDGFIARKDGALDWLYALPNPNSIDHGYESFLTTIDTVILGRNTYEEILGFDVEWPYPACSAYVLTSNATLSVGTPNTQVITSLDHKELDNIKKKSEKNIWVIGGGLLITHLLNMKAIDEMIISIIPTVLGDGIPLFPNHPKETIFSLLKAESFETGVVNLHYEKKIDEKAF